MDDAPLIFNTIKNQREYLGKWLPFVANTKELKDTQQFIQSVTEETEERIDYVFVILYDNHFAGTIGYRGTDLVNKKTELGYWLSEPFQGRGIITKSVERLVEYSFKHLQLNRVMIRCAVGNEKSKRIPKALNFTFEGIERAGELLSDSTFTDLEVYSFLRSEFMPK